MAGVFWTGSDGNVYGKGTDFSGVKNFGGGREFVAGVGQYGSYKQITDPNRQLAGDPNVNPGGDGTYGQVDMPFGPNAGAAGVGTGGAGSQFVDTSAARNVTQGQLGSLDKQLANMDASAQAQFEQLMAQYNEENAANLENYNSQTAKNENVRSAGMSQSLASAAQGGKGLRATLASMGALGGTGALLANRAVASSANKDVGGVNETFDTNVQNLGSAWKNTEREQRQRNEEASTGLQNARTKNAGSIASQRQSLMRDMAGFWEKAGNGAEANNWLARVGGENSAIERASLAATPSFQRASAAFSPQALKNYLAGNQDMAVEASPVTEGVTMNSPLYAQRQRREEYA
jgi:hypothetical protein